MVHEFVGELRTYFCVWAVKQWGEKLLSRGSEALQRNVRTLPIASVAKLGNSAREMRY